MIRRISIILSLLLLGSCACAIVPPIGNVPPPEILEQYLPSPLIPVDTAPGGSIGLLKYLPDGTQVEIAGKVVSGIISQYVPIVFYVQESDRSAGIRVTTEQTITLGVGNVVDVSGTLATVNGERVLGNATVSTPTLTASVEPMLIALGNIGGGPAGDYQPGVTLRVPSTGVPILDAIGINNIGLLAQIYGKVTYVSGDQTYFYVDDGSDVYFNSAIAGGMDDNIGSDVWDGTTHEISSTIYKNLGVMVRAIGLTSLPVEGDFIGVVGIVGARVDSENRVLPLLQPRDDDDILTEPSDFSTVSLSSPGDCIVPEVSGQVQQNLIGLPLPIAFDTAHSDQYPPRAYYFMGQGYLWTYSGWHHAQKQLPVDPEDTLKAISSFTHGAGYWLRVPGAGITYQAVADDVTDRWISLPYPWYNLFGHPLNHDVLWSDLKVTDGKRMAGLEEADQEHLQWVCSVGVWWEPAYSSSRDIGLPDDYAFTETMQSWHAYHMYAYKPVALIVPGTTYPPGPGIPARGSIAATVTDTNTPANPLIGARVYCKYGSALTTQPSGTAEIQDLPAGQYLVTASARGYKSMSQIVNVAAGDPTPCTFALESRPGRMLFLTANPGRILPNGTSKSTIRAYLTDLEGGPVPGEEVTITTDMSHFVGDDASVTGNTNSEGVFSAELLSLTTPNTATLTATCGMLSAQVQVQFTSESAIEGTVSNAGQPIEGALVADGSKTVLTDASGHYVLPNVSGPQVTVVAVAQGYAPNSQTIAISPGALVIANFYMTAYAGSGYTYAVPTGPVTCSGDFTNQASPTISGTFVVDDDVGLPPNVNSSSIVMRMDGSIVSHSYNSTTKVVSYTPPASLAEGVHGVVITSQDGSGTDNPVSSWYFYIDVTNPVATLSSAPASTLTGDILFNGTVTDANLLQYALYLEQNSALFALIGSGNENKVSSLLGSSDTTSLPDGQYTVVLRAEDLAGNATEQRYNVTLSNSHLITAHILSPQNFAECTEGMSGYPTYVQVGYSSASGSPIARVELYAVPIADAGIDYPVSVPASTSLAPYLVGTYTLPTPEMSGSYTFSWSGGNGWFALTPKAYDTAGVSSYSGN